MTPLHRLAAWRRAANSSWRVASNERFPPDPSSYEGQSTFCNTKTFCRCRRAIIPVLDKPSAQSVFSRLSILCNRSNLIYQPFSRTKHAREITERNTYPPLVTSNSNVSSHLGNRLQSIVFDRLSTPPTRRIAIGSEELVAMSLAIRS